MVDMGTNIYINLSRQGAEFEQIKGNYIYNRYDLQRKKAYLLKVCDDKQVYFIPLHIADGDAELGISLADLPLEIVRNAIHFVFKQFPVIKRIRFFSACNKIGICNSHNYFTIPLPENIEELHNRSSAKSRQTMRRKVRILEKDLGDFTIQEFTADTVPEKIIVDYFNMKQATHNVDYHMTAREYLQKYYVTNVYVLSVKQQTGAIILSCEQCPGVYLENLTYDVQLAKYSLGSILYECFIEKLVEKGKKELFLAGGAIAYKRHYGSVERIVYDGIVYRCFAKELSIQLYRLTKRIIRRVVKTIFFWRS